MCTENPDRSQQAGQGGAKGLSERATKKRTFFAAFLRFNRNTLSEISFFPNVHPTG